MLKIYSEASPMKILRFLSALLIAILPAIALDAAAQAFPSKPVKVVVPYPPGGLGDVMMRVLADEMGKGLGQPVIIENKPGAGAVLGYEFAARAPADGYTMLVVFPSFIVNPMVRRVAYDPKDFRAIGQAIFVPLLVVVNPEVPAKSLADLLALARAKPGQLAYGTPGQGTTHHVFGEMLKLATKIDLTHAPFQGGGPALTAVMGGHVPIVIGNVAELGAHASAGKIRALFVTSESRVESLPDVPSIVEAGYPELVTVNWSGLVVPAGTPTAAIARLSAELIRALNAPEVKAKLRLQGMVPAPTTPERFGELLRSETARYGATIKEAGIKLE
jgi:tripartite-type tricarboxylate transporter receptor subunit TctC